MGRSLRLGLAIVAGVCGAGWAEELVPFVIPADVDDGSLIAFAAEAIAPDGPRVVADGGQFRRGGRRFRVWGVNLCFGANFPTHQDSERVARRLAAAGINSVRFHHMDNRAFPDGIWDAADAKKLSAEALDRLDYLLDQLARGGIVANLNLHVSRTHSRALGLPPSGASYDKLVTLFTPALIEAQKDYARQLLTHVNRCRKVRYADDSAVAFVEITNENSLFMWGWQGRLRGLGAYYRKVLLDRYAAWLKSRYGGMDGLKAAWGAGAEPLGANVLAETNFARPVGGRGAAWQIELHGTCRAAAGKAAGGGVRVEVTATDGTDWHVQLKQAGLAVKKGRYYTLAFEARTEADKARAIGCGVGQAHQPWRSLGLGRRVELAAQWRPVREGFTATADDADARVTFALGAGRGAVEVRNVSLCPGGREALGPGESIEAGSVDLFFAGETPARELDRMRFLADVEKAYFDGMYAFIKKDLGCKALVTGTIAFGPCGLWGQSGMDFIDTHAYWQHPRFPGRPWDPGNWTVAQTAMTDHPDAATLGALAARRVAGKPFTVSEYNHPAPNDAQAECVPLLASFAAAQDWDGIWLFAYSHRRDDWDAGRIRGFFDIDHNPAKWGFAPAGAVLFRQGGLGSIAAGATVSLGRSAQTLTDLAQLHLRYDSGLNRLLADREKITGQAMLNLRVAVALAAGQDERSRPEGPSTAKLTWTVDEKRRPRCAAWGPRGFVLAGHADGPVAVGPAQVLSHAAGLCGRGGGGAGRPGRRHQPQGRRHRVRALRKYGDGLLGGPPDGRAELGGCARADRAGGGVGMPEAAAGGVALPRPEPVRSAGGGSRPEAPGRCDRRGDVAGVQDDVVPAHGRMRPSTRCRTAWTGIAAISPAVAMTWTLGPRGAKCTGLVGPKRATVGVPTAPARWETPESFPT